MEAATQTHQNISDKAFFKNSFFDTIVHSTCFTQQVQVKYSFVFKLVQ